MQCRAVVRVPAALLALPLLAGTSAGVLLINAAPDRLIIVSAFAALLSAVAAAGFFAEDEPHAAILCVCLGSLLAGYSMATATTRGLVAPSLLVWFDSLAEDAAEPVVLEGQLRDDAALFEYGATLSMEVDAAASIGGEPLRRSGGVRLVVGGNPPRASVSEWRAGRRVRVAAILRYPAAFSNPGVSDERRQLALRGIVLNGTIKSASLVDVRSKGSILQEWAASARAWTRDAIAQHVGRLDARSAAIATAILIGDRTGLSEEDERRLQRAGTYHVIAISGGNIAILTALLVFAAMAMRVPYRASAILSILILLFYGEVAGGSASVSRALTAAIVFLTALMLDHRGATLNVVAVAVAIAIASTPVATFDGGFLLSFGATTGIVLGVPLMRRPAGPIQRHGIRRILQATGRIAVGVASATLCAEVALAPVAATLFSRVTLAGLLLNFAAIPLMTAVQCGSMALLASARLSTPAADAIGSFVHWSAWALVESASAVDLFPWAARDVPPPALWLSACYYAAAVAVFAVPRYRRIWSLCLLLAGAAIFYGIGGAPAVRAGGLRVIVMDVGQGDATLAVLPDGRALLVDAGGLAGTTFEMGRRVIVPVIRALGVRELHALVLTHGDPDHIGGALEVLRSLPVAHVWEGVPVPPHPLLRDLAQLADARHIVWRSVRPGDIERDGPVELRVHHPPEPEWERQRVRNDDSVVLELRYGDVSILLPGDIEREGEQRLTRTLSLAPLVVLKAPHHGSATSSSEGFIAATHPRAVIFSAGRNNRFGHPSPVVVERYRRRGVEMFTTANDGAVFVETDGESVAVWGWRTGRRLSIHNVH